MWVREDQITLGQIMTAEKSNEITAIPQLLQSLDIRGGVVTTDAMGSSRKVSIARKHKMAGWDNDFALSIISMNA